LFGQFQVDIIFEDAPNICQQLGGQLLLVDESDQNNPDSKNLLIDVFEMAKMKQSDFICQILFKIENTQ
jgi:hypothetical protein